GEGIVVGGAGVELALQFDAALFVEAGSDPAVINQLVALPSPKQKRSKPVTLFGGAPATDHELLPVQAFDLEPRLGPLAVIRRVSPLGDDAFQPKPAHLSEDLFAAATNMVGELDGCVPVGYAEQLLEPLLAVEQRQAGEVFAVLLEKIEGEIDERVAVRQRVLQRREIGPPVLEGADFTVDQGRTRRQLRQCRNDRRELACPVVSCPGV